MTRTTASIAYPAHSRGIPAFVPRTAWKSSITITEPPCHVHPPFRPVVLRGTLRRRSLLSSEIERHEYRRSRLKSRRNSDLSFVRRLKHQCRVGVSESAGMHQPPLFPKHNVKIRRF